MIMSMIMIDKNYFSVKLSRGNVRLKRSFPRLHAQGKKSQMIILKASQNPISFFIQTCHISLIFQISNLRWHL